MTEESDEGANDSLNELFEILSHEYRRYILWVLADPERRTEGGLGAILRTEDGEEPDLLELELRHNHLPKLDDYDLVDWDPSTETLTRGSRFAEVEPFLDVVDESRDDIF
ncbi:DUF7344 domain-containing protein [Haloplanus natans]|uniref:DUF7344 domain-containing protein n=1 Tax=Haloplanus natans TaxID=376171 RepID=UPI000677905E|nr:hypothetical protein [Haloplanus natans]